MCEIFDWCADNIYWIISTVVTAVCAIYAVLQYRLGKNNILSRLNERYATDPNIQKVTNYLSLINNDPLNLQKYESIKPIVSEVEMFMRFIEELQIEIDEKRVDPQNVNNLFSYYALELVKRPDLLPSNYPHGKNWVKFEKFIGQAKQQENN